MNARHGSGDNEVLPGQTAPIIDGHSLAIAIHQHHHPGPDDADAWDHTQQPRSSRGDLQAQRPIQENIASVPSHLDATSRAPLATQPNKTPVLLNLEAVIPDECTHADSQLDDALPQMLWFSDEAWMLRMQRCPPCQLRPLPDGLRMPDVCYWPLIHPVPPDSDSTSPLTLYLDGSANGTHAAWSVIATLQVTQMDQVTEAFIGCLYGVVHIAPEHPAWAGAQSMDNIAAELSALAFAQQVAIRWPHNHSICIRPDLSLSRLVATATTVCKSNTLLSQICRAQGYWLAPTTHIKEIRGHKGFAWNELADAVAKWTLHNAPEEALDEFAALHDFATHQHDVAWTWMQTTHESVAACYPP